MMKFYMTMRRLMFILVRRTSQSTTSGVEDEDGRHVNLKMDDITKKAKGMDDIVILCKACALIESDRVPCII